MVISNFLAGLLRHKNILLLGAILSLTANSAFAVTIPPSADPTRAITKPEIGEPKRNEPVLKEAPARQTPESAAAKQFLILGGVRIEGVTVYPADKFLPLYKDMIGKKVSVADIQAIAAKITQQYRTDGYVLAVAFVPTQNVTNGGSITIVVSEGYVSKIHINGDAPNDQLRGLVETYSQKIMASRPLQSADLERYLLLINDLPGNVARAVLKPSATKPGASEMFVEFAHKYLDAVFDTSNRNSVYLGPWQTSLTLSANSIFGLDERTILRGIVTGQTEELKYFDVQHEEQIGNEGTKIVIDYSHSNTKPGDVLKPFEVKGRTDDLRFILTHPFLRSRLENFTGRAELDILNSTTDVTGFEQSDDQVRSFRLGFLYDTTDSFEGSNRAFMQLSQGINGLGATKDGTGRTRINGEHDYTKVNFDAYRIQALPNSFSLFTAATGQYAFDPLLSSEQFTLGGPSYGTAYDPGELSGDHGLASKVELRYGQAVGAEFLDSFQLYSYYDIGKVWLRTALAGEAKNTSLSSTGLGVRTNFIPSISGNLELSKPLTKNVATNSDKDSRIFAGLTLRY